MDFLLVPHQVTDTTAKIWVGAIDLENVGQRSVRLELSSSDGDKHVVSLNGARWERWQSFEDEDPQRYDRFNSFLHRAMAVIRAEPVKRTLHYQCKEVDGLKSRTSYSARLHIDSQRAEGADRYLREGQVTTLPASLPARDEKPFTLLLGSCYYGPEDANGTVGATYCHIPEDERPDIKVLCGDQVYLDNPWRE